MNKKIGAVLVIVLLVCAIIVVSVLINSSKVSNEIADKEIDIYNGRTDIVVISGKNIRNEELIDNFIEAQEQKDTNDLKLDIMYNDDYLTIELKKDGNTDSLVEGRSTWNYSLSKNGALEKEFPYYMYSLGKRIEDTNGGEVVVSFSVRDQDMGAVYPTDVCRYISNNSN